MYKSARRYATSDAKNIILRHAHVTELVLIRLDGDRANRRPGNIVAGVVESITEDGEPRIMPLGQFRIVPTVLTYYPAYTEDDIDRMPDGSWCFLVRG